MQTIRQLDLSRQIATEAKVVSLRAAAAPIELSLGELTLVSGGRSPNGSWPTDSSVTTQSPNGSWA